MSNKELLKDLQKQIAFLGSQLQRMENKPDGIGALDIDMLADKLKYLYAMIFELETADALEEIPEPEKVVVSQVEKPPVVEIKPEPEIPKPKPPEMSQDSVDSRPLTVDSNEFEESVSSMQYAVGSKQEEDAKDPESSIHDPESEDNPTPNIQHPASNKTTADLFSGPTIIAEQFEAKEDTSIAARVTPQVVENLKMAIGINDKFLFINELFKGNPGEYNEAIEKLNTADALPLAETTMHEYSARYEWSDQSEAYARLKKIVTAKFNES